MQRRILLIIAVVIASFVAVLTQTTHAQTNDPIPQGDVARGLIVYQQRCANCHGLLGLGDGELAAQAINPPTPVGSPDYSRAALPTTMFDVISNGRLENGMPLFGDGSSDPLSIEDRWDVIAAIYSFGTNITEIEQGDEITITDLQISQQLSAFRWEVTPTNAVAERVSEIRPDLTEEDTFAVADAWRMGALRAFLGPGTIAGTVQNATIGRSMPSVPLTIKAFEGFEIAEEFEVTTASDGFYTLELDNVPAEWIFRPEINYGGLDYAGQLYRFFDDQMTAVNDIIVYEPTENKSNIALSRLHTVIEASTGFLGVNQLYSFNNSSQNAYVGGIPFSVPANAENVTFLHVSNDGTINSASSVDQTDSGYVDAQPLRPGSNALGLIVRYTIPYEESGSFEHPLDFQPEESSVVLPAGIEIQGGGWTAGQVEDVNGADFITYEGNVGETLTLNLSGSPSFAVDPASGNRILVRDTNRELLIGGVVLAVAVLGSFLLLNRWQKAAPADPSATLKEIAALDDAYANKEIDKKSYSSLRKKLKRKVKDDWSS